MRDLKLIVCDNCFIIRKEYDERKCPVCATGTLRVNNTKYEVSQIDNHRLQDLLKQIKQPEGLKYLIEDAITRYDQRKFDTSYLLFNYLLLPRKEQDSLGTDFKMIIDELLSNVISRRHADLWDAGSKIRLGDIDTLISFQQVLKDFQDKGWGGLLLLEFFRKYELENNQYLIRCNNCSKLYQYAGQNTCILCDSPDMEDFGRKIKVYVDLSRDLNWEELVAQLLCCGEDAGHEKFDKLLSAFFNTHIDGYADYASVFDNELIKSLEFFRNGRYTLSDFLSVIYEIPAKIHRRSGHTADRPYSSRITKSDTLGRKREMALHQPSPYEEFNVPYNDISQRSLVFGSVFSPQEVSLSASFLVQVFIYDGSYKEELEAIAKSADQDAMKRVELPLINNLLKEEKLEITLIAPELSIDQPVQYCVWNGNLSTLQFIVDVTKEFNKRDVICTVIISQLAIPIGHMKFKIKFTRGDEEKNELNNLQNVAHFSKYKRVFISYASEDRPEVLKRVQMLQAAKVDYFQDILSLQPGERWEKSLYRNILISDAFFLFWSTAAKKSKWVKKELIFALNVKNGCEENPPEIIPIVIEGPPIPKPPKELNFLHFNDKLLYLMLG